VEGNNFLDKGNKNRKNNIALGLIKRQKKEKPK
jgi:hypothetical protein